GSNWRSRTVSISNHTPPVNGVSDTPVSPDLASIGANELDDCESDAEAQAAGNARLQAYLSGVRTAPTKPTRLMPPERVAKGLSQLPEDTPESAVSYRLGDLTLDLSDPDHPPITLAPPPRRNPSYANLATDFLAHYSSHADGSALIRHREEW